MSAKIDEYLKRAVGELEAAGVETARLDVLVLLEDVLGMDRASILAHPEAEISDVQEVELNTKIAQRSLQMPLAYVRGKAAFYGRSFLVNSYVLVPRPETEAMIDLFMALPLPPSPKIIDVGSGSGCIGLTACLELRGCQATLCDIDEETLKLARRNAKKLSVHRATFVKGDLLQSVDDDFDVLLANLPYVPTDYPINAAASHEPRLALFADVDGLDLYRQLWRQIAELRVKPRFVITEGLIKQHRQITVLAEQAGYHLSKTVGLVQEFTLS